jgi:hypothetical protein
MQAEIILASDGQTAYYARAFNMFYYEKKGWAYSNLFYFCSPTAR